MIFLSKKQKAKPEYLEVDLETASLSDISNEMFDEVEERINEALDDVQSFVENVENAISNIETALRNGDIDMALGIVDELKYAFEDFLACDECEDEYELQIHDPK